MKILTQIILAFLIIVKIVLGSVFIYQLGFGPSLLERHAIASEPQKEPENGTHETKDVAREEKVDSNYLIEKKAELKKEQADLAREKAELLAIREEINNKIATLTQLRNEIRAQMTEKKAVTARNLKHLIKAYSSMKPQKAASLIDKLDMNFAIALLSNMKGDAVGNILSFVNLEKAAKISEGLVKHK